MQERIFYDFIYPMHWNEPGVCNPLGWIPEAIETRPQATPTTQEHAKELVLLALSSFDVVVCEVTAAS